MKTLSRAWLSLCCSYNQPVIYEVTTMCGASAAVYLLMLAPSLHDGTYSQHKIQPYISWFHILVNLNPFFFNMSL